MNIVLYNIYCRILGQILKWRLLTIRYARYLVKIIINVFQKFCLWVANTDHVYNAKFAPYVCAAFLNALVISWGRCRWLRGLRRRSASARLPRLRVRTFRRHGCLPLASAVSSQLEVSVSGWLLAQKNPTACGVSECDLETSTARRPGSTKAVEQWTKHSPMVPNRVTEQAVKGNWLLSSAQCYVKRSWNY